MLVYKKDVPTKETYVRMVDDHWKRINPPSTKSLRLSEQNLLTAEIPILYANGLSDVADFVLQYYGDANKALNYYKQANGISDYNARTHAAWVLAPYSEPRTATKLNKTQLKQYPYTRSIALTTLNSHTSMKGATNQRKCKHFSHGHI